MFKTYFVIMSALFATHVAALPSGAPVSSCLTMAAFHIPFILPQQGPAPFTLTVSSNQASPRSPIKVTLTANEGPFRGYLIQARTGASTKAIGTFATAGEKNIGKTMNCPGGVANAVTHTSRAGKTSETFLWTPPSKFKGQVVFRATVVENYARTYKGLQSRVVNVNKKG